MIQSVDDNNMKLIIKSTIIIAVLLCCSYMIPAAVTAFIKSNFSTFMFHLHVYKDHLSTVTIICLYRWRSYCIVIVV